MTDTDRRSVDERARRDAQRRRTAFHEAGHAVAGYLYGQPLKFVSIRPGHGYGGIVVFQSSAITQADDFDPSTPVVLQPAAWREPIERELVVTLAGPIAGWATMPRTGYLEPDDCEDAAERAAVGLAAMSSRHQELILAEEGDTRDRHDDETAAELLSEAFVGDEPEEAAAYLRWLRAVAQNLMAAHWYRVEALAGVLLERTVLAGDEAAAIVRAAKRTQARQQDQHG